MGGVKLSSCLLAKNESTFRGGSVGEKKKAKGRGTATRRVERKKGQVSRGLQTERQNPNATSEKRKDSLAYGRSRQARRKK